MLRHVEERPGGSFIVANETGMLYPLKRAGSGRGAVRPKPMAFCPSQTRIT
jgi:hypothetical protein